MNLSGAFMNNSCKKGEDNEARVYLIGDFLSLLFHGTI